MADALVVLENVSLALGGRRVLDSVSFSLSKGDFVTLRGTNGVGKTTLLRCVLGGVKPSSGNVKRMYGRGGAGYVPQVQFGGSVAMPLLVRDVVAIGRCAHLRPWQRESHHDAAAVARAMDTVGIGALADRPSAMLSGGERQKMQLARVLAQEPVLMLLDEPTVHLDADSRTEFLELLGHIYKTCGVAVLMVSHEEHSVPACCRREVELRQGRVFSDRAMEPGPR